MLCYQKSAFIYLSKCQEYIEPRLAQAAEKPKCSSGFPVVATRSMSLGWSDLKYCLVIFITAPTLQQKYRLLALSPVVVTVV